MVVGGLGSDNVLGDSGNDFVDGVRGSDDISGGDGNDYLIDGPFRETDKDTLSGGDGDDVFLVYNRPAARDTVTCGGGFDRVGADTKDVVSDDCERVIVDSAAVPLAHRLTQQLAEEGFFVTFFRGLAPVSEA